MKQILHILLIALMLMGFYSCVPKTELASPDGHIKVAFTADTDGKMMYRVTVNDTLYWITLRSVSKRKTESILIGDFVW